MTKRTTHALALVLSAVPFLLVGCGDSEHNNGTGGSGGGGGGAGGATKYDGGGGAGGAKLDAGSPDVLPPPVDATPLVDVSAPVDTTLVVDAPLGPDAPIALDTAALDTAKLDAPRPVDVTVDTGTVACTMTPMFVGGDVTANLTLTKACSPYTITSDINVDGSAILTIEAGVTLSFQGGVALNVGYTSAGKLVAVGTAQDPITFTSAAATPSDGDWADIYFWGGTMGGTKIAYAKVDYCGSFRYGCIASDGVSANRVTLDHITIDHVGAISNGIQENDSDPTFAMIAITNSTFSHIKTGKYAISVEAPSFAAVGANNVFNGAMIELRGGTVTATTSWVDPGTAIAVTTSDLAVDGSGSPVLTLGAGMTFKFDVGREFDVGYGTGGKLIINGTGAVDGGVAKHVVLTSLSASPSAGDWSGVWVWADSKAQISYADLSFAGHAGSAGIRGGLVLDDYNSTSQLLVDHSSFTDNLGYGIYVPCDSGTTPVATLTLDSASNTFARNASGNVGPGPATGTAACP
jgi:hypothetical protein